MGKVVTYAKNSRQCFCQIKFESGERILISIAGTPAASVKIMKLGLLGIFPMQTIWEYNAAMSGGFDAYVHNLCLMFPDPSPKEPKHPLDNIRDYLLPCRSIREAMDSLVATERSVTL